MLVLNSFACLKASSEQVPYLRSCVVFAQDNKGYISSFNVSLICGPLKLDDGNLIGCQISAVTQEHSRCLASEPFPYHVAGKGCLIRGPELALPGWSMRGQRGIISVLNT